MYLRSARPLHVTSAPTQSECLDFPRAGRSERQGSERCGGPLGSLSLVRGVADDPVASLAVSLTVRPISASQHLDFLRGRRSASFLQTPAWGRAKSEWRHESVGWFDGTEAAPVGAGLVLYRQVPRLKRYLAYLPEGPVIDWDSPDLGDWLEPLTAHLRGERAFGVRMGPPVITRRWSAAQVKEGIASPDVRRLTDLPPIERSQGGASVVSQLTELGWRPQLADGGFSAGQPRYNFWVRLTDAAGAARSETDILAGMNQLWRRNIRKAEKSGVVTTRRGPRGPRGVPRALCPHRRARSLHAATAALLRDDVRRPGGRGARPDHGAPGPPRGRSRRGDDRHPGRRRTRGTPMAPRRPRSARSAGPTPSSGR